MSELREVENIPVEFHGKVIGRARMRSTNGRLEIVFTNPELEGELNQIFCLGLVTAIQLEFEYIAAVEKIIK